MSMWEPFTEEARRAIVRAQDEAQRLGADRIAAEHMLAGILSESDSPVARELAAGGVTLERVRAQLKAGGSAESAHEMIFSQEAKRVIECAFEFAREFSHNYIGSEHLIAGITRQPGSRACAILESLGCAPEETRAKMRILAEERVRSGMRERVVSLHSDYVQNMLREEDMPKDPIVQLQRWIDDAYTAKVIEPNAMSISTVDAEGNLSSRMVLLRGLDARGLVFYTSFLSRKGHDLATNPGAAALFWWPELERQVRIEGSAQQLPEGESDAYFASRPRGHQLSAWASEQSEPVERRELLEQRMHDYEQRFEGQDVPRPHSWGGYLLVPKRFEFWQGRPNRMHDRFVFSLDGPRWRLGRLQP